MTITDFTYVVGDGGTPVTDQVHFGDDTTMFSGGEFIYPNATSTSSFKLVSDVTGSSWHITGAVGDFSGLGLYFDSCSRVDASAFRGISFNISGTVMGGSVTFEVDTLADTITPSWLNAHPPTTTAAPVPLTNPGRCNPMAATAVNQYAQTECVEPTKVITVPTTPTTTPTTVLWSDFITGKPQTAVTPTDIIGIRWIFPNPTGVGTAGAVTYPLDIVVDDLKFVP